MTEGKRCKNCLYRDSGGYCLMQVGYKTEPDFYCIYHRYAMPKNDPAERVKRVLHQIRKAK